MSGHEIVVRPAVWVEPGQTAQATAACRDGKLPVGGGFDADLVVSQSFPAAGAWVTRATNNSEERRLLQAYAICAVAS